MDPVTRRSFLIKGSAGAVGAAGLAAGGLALSSIGDNEPALSASELEEPDGPVVLQITDPAAGEVESSSASVRSCSPTRRSWPVLRSRPLRGSSAMSSHREAPAISKDPVADNTDTYAFVTPDDTVTIITNYLPSRRPAAGRTSTSSTTPSPTRSTSTTTATVART